MKKKLVALTLIMAILISNITFTAFAVKAEGAGQNVSPTFGENETPNPDETQTPDPEDNEYQNNVVIEFVGGSDAYSIGEKIFSYIEIKNVEKDFVAKGGWYVNGEAVKGFSNDKFVVSEGKISSMSFFVPYGTDTSKPINISFKLDNSYINLESSKAVTYSKIDNLIELKISAKTKEVYQNDKLTITVTVKTVDGKTVNVPVVWKKNATAISGFKNNDFVIDKSRSSSFNYIAKDAVGSTNTIEFVINPNGIKGIKTQSVSIPIKVKKRLDYYTENKARVLKEVKTLDVEATARYTTNLYSDMGLRHKIGSVPAGSKVIYDNYLKTTAARIRTSNGKTGWVNFSSIKISTKNYTVYKDFTNLDKEVFARAKGYTSKTNYMAWINLERQKVNIFKKENGIWKIHKVFSCTTGKNSTPTIAGVFKFNRYVNKWDFGKYYVKPVMVFNGGHAFHSRTYTPNGGLLDPTIGTPKSAGCIRMFQSDIDWMWANFPLYSTVVVH